MTTIVYRDGILASDSLVTRNGARTGTVQKIARIGDVLVAASGCLSYCLAFMDWVRKGLPEFHRPTMAGPDDNFAVGIIVYQGRVLEYSDFGWNELKADYYAYGSGSDHALGALALGHTAVEAVQAAIVHDLHSGGPIQVLESQDAKNSHR